MSTRIGEQSISAISPCRPLVHDDVAATAKTSTGGTRYGREARRTLPWLVQRIGCWGRVWSPPLPAPVALFQLFPCGRRWHSQNPITPSFRLSSMAPQFKRQPTHAVSRSFCVSPLDLPSPQQVVHKYISFGTGISCWLSMPAAISPTSLLVPLFCLFCLFCPNFSQNFRRTAQCQSVLPNYPSHNIIRTWCSPVSNLITGYSLVSSRAQPPGSFLLVCLAEAANLFENHRIFSHLSRDLQHTSEFKTAPPSSRLVTR